MAVVVGVAGCGAAGSGEAEWPPVGKKWFDRSAASFRQGDIEDAQVSIENALRIVGDREEVRILAARIALSQLQYDDAIKQLRGINTSDARSIRGRALWYAGRVDQAADELELLLSDPDVRDPWATDVAKLARRGAGRRPFRMTGGLLAVAEMPRVAATALIVPLDVNGEPALGMIATGTAEAVLDSSSGGDPAWVNLRFGERVEVKDVPALTRDLSGISRQINAPIKILLGVNLMRHLHPTFDFTGGQFVVRTFEPPPPPHATTVRLNYVRGGGMLIRGALGADQTAPKVSLLVDTSWTFPVALDDGGWKKAGVKLGSLETVPTMTQFKHGLLPLVRVGAFELPQVTGIYGAPIAELEEGLDIDLDGLVGSGLLAPFRVTLVDGGRTMWLEDIPPEALRRERPPPAANPPPESAPPSTAPGAEGVPAPAPPPPATSKPE